MSVKMVSWNVNGIRAVARKEALSWVDEMQPQVLALQEIKASREQIPDNLFKKEYKELFVSSSVNKGQSGVAVFSDITPDYYSPCFEVDTLKEGRINELHFGKTAFFNVYFPNGKRNQERLEYKLLFYDRFLEHIEQLRTKGYAIIFCGDVNTAHKAIDLARPKENEDISGFLPIERAWIDKVEALGYLDTFRIFHPEPGRYSWWSMRTRARARNVGWRIDYFFISKEFEKSLLESDIYDKIEGSDHAPIDILLDGLIL